MKVPEPVRKFYNFFPLYTYPAEPQTAAAPPAAPKDTLYLYAYDTLDPGCLLAKAILTQYSVAHRTESASAYLTPSRKLPVFVQGKNPLDLDQIIAKYVPFSDKQEPAVMAVLRRVENAYYTLLEERGNLANYKTEKDKRRLWPLNLAIDRQVAAEASEGIGCDRTTTKELEIALRSLNGLVAGREGINLVDLMLYAVLKPLDEIVELPRELQREMIRVADRLDFEGGEELIVFDVDADVGADVDVGAAAEKKAEAIGVL